MKHIVMFSGGAASSVVGKMVADLYPNDTILLHTPTGAEHPDADRFREQVARRIGLPITIEKAKKTLWQYIELSWRYISNHSLPKCTQRLKMDPQNRYLKRIEVTGEEFIIYVGLGYDEPNRIKNVSFRNLELGRNVAFPLFEARLTGEDCKRIVRDEWGICLPEPYKHLKHNNCIPCYKGGEGHWFKVWQHYPEQFYRAARAEERAANTVFNGVTLYELAAKWERQPIQPELFGEESMPCMCAI